MKLSLKRLHLRPEFWAALIVLIIGALQLLDRIGIAPLEMLQTYWPALFILSGIVQAISERYRDPASVTVLILVGTALLLLKGGFVNPDDVQADWLQSLLQLLQDWINGTRISL